MISTAREFTPRRALPSALPSGSLVWFSARVERKPTIIGQILGPDIAPLIVSYSPGIVIATVVALVGAVFSKLRSSKKKS